MKLMFKKLSLLGFIGLLFISIAGCVTTTTVSELTDTEKVAAVLAEIDLGDVTAVSANLTLSTATVNGVSLSWATSNADIISNSGVVSLPKYTDGNQVATLTVTATLGSVVQTKAFNVTVTAESANTFLTRAGAAIIINGSDAITAGFNLPATALGASVTWSSSNASVASIAATAVDGQYAVTINRPQADDGGVNTSVTLTATISIDSANITVEKSIRVIAEESSVRVNSIAEGLDLPLGTYITYQGMTIVGVGTDGFFFTDGTDVLFVYNASVAATVVAGGVYDVTGGIALYNSIPEVQNIASNVVKVSASSVAARPITPVAATVQEVIANHTGYTAENPMQFGVYSVTAKVYYDSALGSYGTYLIPTDATTLDKANALRIYYKSNMNAVSALAGQTVTLTYVVFGYNSGANYLDWYGYFFGTSNDIQVAFATDQEAINAALATISVPTDVIAATTLNLPSALYGVALTYTSSNAAVINPTTGAVDLTGLNAQVSVTITVTATKGTTTSTRDFVVKVGETPLSSVADVLAMTIAAQTVKIQGTVYALMQNAYFVSDGTGMILIYTNPASGMALGDTVLLHGTLAAYKGTTQLTNAVVESTVSTGNDYTQTPQVYLPGTTVLVPGQTYSIVASVFVGDATGGTYSNVYFKDLAGNFLCQIYYKTISADYNLLKTFDGQTVKLNVVFYNNATASNSYDIYFIYQSVDNAPAVATDADYLALDALKLPASLELEGDYLYPSLDHSTISIKAISTELAAYVADGSTKLNITAPEGSDVTGTVTFTLTKGEATLDVEVSITIKGVIYTEKLAADLADLTVAETAFEYGSVTLPLKGAAGSTIAWEIVSGAATLNGAVLDYTLTGADYTVVLQATLSIGNLTPVTKDFTVAVTAITVLSVGEAMDLIQALGQETASINGSVEYVQGTIIGFKWKSNYTQYTGIYLSDGTDVVYVYTGTLNTDVYAVGDVIVVKGLTQTYYYLPEVGSVTLIKVLADEVAANYFPVPVTLDDLYAYTNLTTPYYSQQITITGTLNAGGTESTTYLVDAAGHKLVFSYVTSNYASLIPYDGTVVTLTGGFVNDYHTGNLYWRLTGANVVVSATDSDKVYADITKLPTTLELTENYVLPTPGFSTYEVLISAELQPYLTNVNGVLTVTLPESADAVGIITVLVTLGDITQGVVINVTVKAMTETMKAGLAAAEIPATLGLVDDYLIPTLYSATFSNLVVPTELVGLVALSADATTLEIMRPSGAGSATGTITVSITVGAVTITKDITLTILGDSDLFFSEYIEGSSNNKALEIYNPTGADVNLTGYTIELYSNGVTVPTYVYVMTGTLVAGDVFVIRNIDAALAEIIAASDAVGGAYPNSAMIYNGDDALVLKHNGIVIDSIGQVGFRPSGSWNVGGVSTVNMTLVRISSITVGDTNPFDVYDPSTTWVAYPQDTTTYLGSHSTATPE